MRENVNFAKEPLIEPRWYMDESRLGGVDILVATDENPFGTRDNPPWTDRWTKSWKTHPLFQVLSIRTQSEPTRKIEVHELPVKLRTELTRSFDTYLEQRQDTNMTHQACSASIQGTWTWRRSCWLDDLVMRFPDAYSRICSEARRSAVWVIKRWPRIAWVVSIPQPRTQRRSRTLIALLASYRVGSTLVDTVQGIIFSMKALPHILRLKNV